MYVKTNIVGLAMLNANVGVEFDLGKYLSLSVPVSYSAIDYFKSTIKFRNFSLQPELRFWPKRNLKGLFVGAHMGFAYYKGVYFKQNWVAAQFFAFLKENDKKPTWIHVQTGNK